MTKIKNKQFIYKSVIKWQDEKKGELSSLGKPDIQIATPAEFRGHSGMWSPEDLFVAAVNSCIMTTFLYYAQREGFQFLSYESESEGILEFMENKLIFTEIKIKPKVSVKQDSDIEKAKNLLELSRNNCLISNSIKTKIEVIPQILTQS